MASTVTKPVRDALVAKIRLAFSGAVIKTSPFLAGLGSKDVRANGLYFELTGPFKTADPNALIGGNTYQGEMWDWEISFLVPTLNDRGDEVADEVFELLRARLAAPGVGVRLTAACSDLEWVTEGATGYTVAGLVYTAVYRHPYCP